MEGVVGRRAVALAEALVVVQGEGWVWGTLVEEQVGRNGCCLLYFLRVFQLRHRFLVLFYFAGMQLTKAVLHPFLFSQQWPEPFDVVHSEQSPTTMAQNGSFEGV